MRYNRISADCHLDMPWMPPDSSREASRELKDRMPYVAEGPEGPRGSPRTAPTSACGTGWARGAKHVPGQHRRVDIMAETGLYEDGKKGIRRPGDPHLRVKEMDRDGVDAEVIYGILGRRAKLKDRGGRRDAAHLQRLAERLLQPLSRSPHRPRLPALRRHRRRGRRRSIASPSWASRASSCRARGTWSRCGIRCWEPLWQAIDEVALRCTSTPSRRSPPSCARSTPGPRSARADVQRPLPVPDDARDILTALMGAGLRALSRTCGSPSARAASAGSRTCSTAWTSSTRTSTRTCHSR